MPTCKKDEVYEVNDLVKELEMANEEIKKVTADEERERSELLILCKDFDRDQSMKYIKKASAKIIDKLYGKYKKKRTQKAN